MSDGNHMIQKWLGIIGLFKKIGDSPMGKANELHNYCKGDAWWYYNKKHDTIMPMSKEEDIPTPVKSSAKMFGDNSRWLYIGKTHNGVITETFEKDFA